MTKPVTAEAVVAKALTAIPDGAPWSRDQMATLILTALAKAGFEVLDGCHRCGADATEHWCADLEETFN